jgi:hypothetical protein
MSKVTKAVQGFLRLMEWRWQEMEPTRYRVIVPGNTARWVWMAHWEEDDSFFASYSFSPANVPAKHRPAAAEYLMWANYNLRLGNFEMDYSDGQVCFKTSMIMNGIRPTPDLVKQVAFANFSTMDQYLPGLMSVIYGNERPKDVIRRIEQANRSQEQPEPDQSESAEGSGCAKPPKRVLDPAAERNRRVDQIAQHLKLMQERRQAEAKGSCFLICDAKNDMDEARLSERGTTSTVQFCFKDKWFAMDIPNAHLQPADARKILRRRGFYREADRPDVALSNKQQVVDFDPIGKKYIYGDEREAAEDAAYVLFDVWRLPVDAGLLVSAFSSEGSNWEKDVLLG